MLVPFDTIFTSVRSSFYHVIYYGYTLSISPVPLQTSHEVESSCNPKPSHMGHCDCSVIPLWNLQLEHNCCKYIWCRKYLISIFHLALMYLAKNPRLQSDQVSNDDPLLNVYNLYNLIQLSLYFFPPKTTIIFFHTTFNTTYNCWRTIWLPFMMTLFIFCHLKFPPVDIA